MIALGARKGGIFVRLFVRSPVNIRPSMLSIGGRGILVSLMPSTLRYLAYSDAHDGGVAAFMFLCSCCGGRW